MDSRTEKSKNQPRGHGHRLCIVDDDAAVRDSMRALLESYGFEIQEFGSADAFLKAPFEYCCLIVDHRMPCASGLELLELLRIGGIEAPAILMIDKDEPALAARIGSVTAFAPLVKPVAEKNLIRSILAACERTNCGVIAAKPSEDISLHGRNG